MPVPKRKQSRSRKNSRSANKGIKAKPFSVCKTQNCHASLPGHTVCRECGMYNGKQVIKPSNFFQARKSLVKVDA